MSRPLQALFDGDRCEQVMTEFSELVEVYSRAKGKDAIATEHLAGVSNNYRKLIARFVAELDKEIDQHLEAIFLDPNDRNGFQTLEKHHDMFSSVQNTARLRVADRWGIWYRIAGDPSIEPRLGFRSNKLL